MSTPTNQRATEPATEPRNGDPSSQPTRPPDHHQLEAATARLPRCSDLLAALHLALPVDEVPTSSIRLSAGRFSYRGLSVLPAADPWRTAARLAAAGHRSSDRYLDLSEGATPVNWVKLLRSGSHVVAFGSDYLLGEPQVVFDPRVTHHLATSLLVALLDPDVPLDLPSVRSFRGGRLLLSGDAGRITAVRA